MNISATRIEYHQQSLAITNKNKVYDFLCKFILVWVVLQDFILAIFYRVTGSVFATNILFYSKDICLILLLLSVVFSNRKINFSIILYFAYVVVIAIFTMASGRPLINVAASFRGLILLPAFFLIGKNINNKQQFHNWLLKYYKFIIICCVLGIIEYFFDIFVGTKKFWTDFVRIGKFLSDIKKADYGVFQGLPGNFYGSYGGAFFSQKRFVGIWVSPLTAAYSLAWVWLVLLCNYSKLNRKWKIGFLIISFALVLTFTRAVLIPLALVFFIYLCKGKYKATIMLFIPLITLYVLLHKNSILSFFYDGSTIGHIIGIIEPIRNHALTLFGNGIGTFGAASALTNNLGVVGQGTESFFLSTTGQIGIVGLLLFLVVFFKACNALWLNYQRSNNKFYHKIFLAFLVSSIVYFATGFVSEQLSAFTAIAPFYILLGFYSDQALIVWSYPNSLVAK